MVVALLSNWSAFRFVRASAASFDFASADSSCPRAAAGTSALTNAIAAIASRSAVFIDTSCRVKGTRVRRGTLRTSTVLRTRRNDLPARQRNRADQTGAGVIPRATDFDRERLPNAALEVGLADVADSEPRRRRSFGLPALGRAGSLHVDRQVGVRVAPIDLR